MSVLNSSIKELLSPYLVHPWMGVMQSAWPVSFFCENDKYISGNDWKCYRIEEKESTSNHLSWDVEIVNTKTQIEAHIFLTLWRDTNILMMSGYLSNKGSNPVHNLKHPKVIDVHWKNTVASEPFIRTFRGGSWGDIAYPPIGYRCEDVQLLRHYQHWRSIKISCRTTDGRCSQDYQPVMIIGDNKRSGILLALEWAGSYDITCHRTQDTWGHQLDADFVTTAGIAGVDISFYPDMQLDLPNAWLLFYDGSLDDAGQAWRCFFNSEMAPQIDGKPVVPFTSYNHWMAYEIELFNEKTAILEAEQCAKAGLEYFVFDAGWYKGGFRNGNGNWEICDKEKIPSGMEELSRKITKLGLKFGLWLEPEYASVSSKLVREHPEWFLDSEPVNNGEFKKGDKKNVLMNFSLKEVQDWWVKFIIKWVEEFHISWIRWDFNQPPGPIWQFNDTDDSKGLTQIHHIQGLYATLDRILEDCPNLVIEQCAGGGTRVEPGILRRAHTYWISDHSSSPHLVRYYQHGMNLLWPAQYANMNVFSRQEDLSESQWLSYQTGSFGVSSRLVDWSDSKRKALRGQILRFKQFRSWLNGDFYSSTGQPLQLKGKHELIFGNGNDQIQIVHDLDHDGVTFKL